MEETSDIWHTVDVERANILTLEVLGCQDKEIKARHKEN